MNNNDKFLKSYKELEKVLSVNYGENSPVLAYENTLQDGSNELNKIRLCRNIRNFLQHNDNNGFIETTEIMNKYLETLINKLSSEDDFVGSKMIKISKGKNKFDIKDKIVDMAKGIEKYQTVLIYNGDKFLGICDAYKYLIYSNKNKLTKTSKIDKCFNKVICSYMTEARTYESAKELLNEGVDIVLVYKEKETNVIGYLFN